MSFDQTFLAKAAQDHLGRTLTLPQPRDVFERIESEAQKEGQPAVGRETGSLLRALVAARGAKSILEVGTNLGYSALWMATALPEGGQVDTLEIDADLAKRARAHFADAKMADRVKVLEGAALATLPRLLDQSYDLVFLDAVKAEYPQYLDHALRLLRPGGVVCADNLFWLGRAWDEDDTSPDTLGVREYTRRVFEDPRFVSTLVAAEDGLGVSVLRG